MCKPLEIQIFISEYTVLHNIFAIDQCLSRAARTLVVAPCSQGQPSAPRNSGPCSLPASFLRGCILVAIFFLSLNCTFAQTGSFDSGQRGIDAVLLIDNSGTMRLSDPTRLRDEGVRLFTQFLSPEDRIAVVEFDETPRLIQDFVHYSGATGEQLLQRIRQGSLDGYYTDITEAVRFSCSLLETRGREEAAPSIILLSDGKMEPNPSRGSAELVTAQLFYEILPSCSDEGIHVHTLAFSDEADRDLLRKTAEFSGGVNWFAPTAESIHQSFAELFLVVKKPQILPLTQRGFEIDSGVEEATFYLNNEGVQGEIALRTPAGRLVRSDDLPRNIRWFSSEKFEVITIEEPERGTWEILGVPSRESFATVLTSLRLLSDWPASVIAGEEVLLQARLQEDDKPVVLPEMTEVLQMGFQVLPTDKIAEPVIRNVLVDDGTNGDLRANDGVFSRRIIVEEPGEYRLDIVANAPTFQRYQRIPFRVRPRLIDLSVVRVDHSSVELGTSVVREYFRVELSQDAAALQGINLRLTAIDERRRRIEIPLVQSPTNTLRYEALIAAYLPADGEYQVQATITGEDRRRQRVRGQSLPLVYERVTTEIDEALEVVVVQRKEPTEHSSPIFPFILMFLSQTGAGVFFFLKIRKQQSAVSLTIPPYEPDPELIETIESLKARSALSSIDEQDPVLAADYEFIEPPVSNALAAFEESPASDETTEAVSEEGQVNEEDAELDDSDEVSDADSDGDESGEEDR